jgi:hypothetical protein
MRSPHTNRPRSSLRHPFAAIALAAAVLSAGTASPAPPADSDEVIYQEPITVEGVRASPVRLDELEVLFQTTAPLPERGWRNVTTGLPNFRVAAGGAG